MSAFIMVLLCVGRSESSGFARTSKSAVSTIDMAREKTAMWIRKTWSNIAIVSLAWLEVAAGSPLLDVKDSCWACPASSGCLYSHFARHKGSACSWMLRGKQVRDGFFRHNVRDIFSHVNPVASARKLPRGRWPASNIT